MARLEAGSITLLGILVGLPVAVAGDGGAFRCELGELVRKVEVRSPAGARLPCEVVYLRATEEPGVARVLWRAENEPQYCRRQARGLVEELGRSGWQCNAIAADRHVRPPTPAVAEPDPPPDDVRPEDRPPTALDSALDAAIREDLELLADSAEHAIDVEIGSYGDLNGDGIGDAAVLFTFDPEGPNHAQYLVVYLGDGESFRPAASRFIGGRYREIFRGRVEGIEGGEIMLGLQVLRDDDPYCCPSGAGIARYALREGRLVSVE